MPHSISFLVLEVLTVPLHRAASAFLLCPDVRDAHSPAALLVFFDLAVLDRRSELLGLPSTAGGFYSKSAKC